MSLCVCMPLYVQCSNMYESTMYVAQTRPLHPESTFRVPQMTESTLDDQKILFPKIPKNESTKHLAASRRHTNGTLRIELKEMTLPRTDVQSKTTGKRERDRRTKNLWRIQEKSELKKAKSSALHRRRRQYKLFSLFLFTCQLSLFRLHFVSGLSRVGVRVHLGSRFRLRLFLLFSFVARVCRGYVDFNEFSYTTTVLGRRIRSLSAISKYFTGLYGTFKSFVHTQSVYGNPSEERMMNNGCKTPMCDTSKT